MVFLFTMTIYLTERNLAWRYYLCLLIEGVWSVIVGSSGGMSIVFLALVCLEQKSREENSACFLRIWFYLAWHPHSGSPSPLVNPIWKHCQHTLKVVYHEWPRYFFYLFLYFFGAQGQFYCSLKENPEGASCKSQQLPGREVETRKRKYHLLC